MTRVVRPLQLVPDIARHGVTRYAREIARASGCQVAARVPHEAGQRVHVHFTERLWGSSPDSAAEWLSELGRRHRVSVTLHDLPQRSDGLASEPRRSAAYAQVVDVAAAVVCNSHWEAHLLAAFARPSHPPRIIPLAVRPQGAPLPDLVAPGTEPVIGLLGFIYPGKGHAEAIDAASACSAVLGRQVGVVALGTVAAGHETDVEALRDRARERGVPFSVTGYLSDDQLISRAREVDVPLSAHQHVSASGSIGSWLSAGRRPLVIDSPYAREIEALRPGTIRRYEPSDLGRAVTQTLTHPNTSWLDARAGLQPGPAETAAAYLEWWTHEVPW